MHDMGIFSTQQGDNCVLLGMDSEPSPVKHCLCNDANPCESDKDTFCKEMDTDAMAKAIVETVHRVHQGQTVLVPASKWRSVFDAVAFSMAEDELWQEFDASATIKLNTRDPLLFEAGDEHTLAGLITSLMNDGESIEQSVFLIPAGAPLLIHISPGGPVKFWFGNHVLADEVSEAYAR